MTIAPPLLYLPLLHSGLGKICREDLPAAYIWPGLPQAIENSWTADKYPFSPKEAEACLKDIQSMSDAALSGVPLQAFVTKEHTRAELKKMEEQEAIAHFTSTGEQVASAKESAPLASVHQLRAAQKFLLWAWLMEEHLLEVQRLTENYTLGAANLTSALGAEKDDALAGLEYIQNLLSTDTFALPPWRIVLENMAYFLPEHSVAIINNKDMLEHIFENCSPVPLSETMQNLLGINATEQYYECTVSLATLLEKKQKSQEQHLEKTLYCILAKDAACQ